MAFLAAIPEILGGLAEGGAAAGAAEGAGAAAAGAAEGGAAAGGGGGLSGMLGKFTKAPGMQAIRAATSHSFSNSLPFAFGDSQNRNLNQDQFGGLRIN